MAHFAKIENDKVVEVIVIDNEFENDGQKYINEILNLPGEWIQTSYNNNFRKQFAGVGFTYNRAKDAFIAIPPSVEGFDNLEVFLDENLDWQIREKNG